MWVLLSYWLPREPSTPRITLWRKLKRLGVAQLGDGLVALPDRADTREQLEWLAAEVSEAGGRATTWVATPTAKTSAAQLTDELSTARAAEYEAVAQQAKQAAGLPEGERHAVKRKLLAELHRIGKRDYFPPPESKTAHQLVKGLETP